MYGNGGGTGWMWFIWPIMILVIGTAARVGDI
jgi:putative membrane protein